jgi:hypothetical protein
MRRSRYFSGIGSIPAEREPFGVSLTCFFGWASEGEGVGFGIFGMLMVRPGSEGLGRMVSTEDEGVPNILCCSFFADAIAAGNEHEDDSQRRGD